MKKAIFYISLSFLLLFLNTTFAIYLIRGDLDYLKNKSEKGKVLSLVMKYGQNPIAYLTMEDDKYYFFGINLEGVCAYTVAGIVLVICGDMPNYSYLKKQIDFFRSRYQVVVIDSRGHGDSEFGSDKLTLDLLADDIKNIIMALNLNHCIILGFCKGGNIAFKLDQIISEFIETD